MTAAFDLPARDGLRLTVDWFAPEGAACAAVLIAPAMGVTRRYYAPFARYLREHGVATLVANYRGMDGSDADPRARLRDWAHLDLAAAAEWLALRVPAAPRIWVGHSVGAQLFGLLPNAPFDRALFVAGQSGWSGHWPTARSRIAIRALWWAAIPVLTRVFGRLPMKAAGQGEDVPPAVAREWASWGRDPRYIRSYADTLHTDGFRTWRNPLRVVSFTDDPYAPPSTACALAAMYREVRPELAVVRPADVALQTVGHFGAFREASGSKLWGDFRAFIMDGPPGTERAEPQAGGVDVEVASVGAVHGDQGGR